MGRTAWSSRKTAEQCLAISTSWLKQGRYLDGAKTGEIAWKFGEKVFNVGIQTEMNPEGSFLVLNYSISRGEDERKYINYKIPLVSAPCRFGGKRYWLRCLCNRRVGVLYLPLCATENYFCCRHCYNLTYRSAQEHQNNDYMFNKLFAKVREGLL